MILGSSRGRPLRCGAREGSRPPALFCTRPFRQLQKPRLHLALGPAVAPAGLTGGNAIPFRQRLGCPSIPPAPAARPLLHPAKRPGAKEGSGSASTRCKSGWAALFCTRPFRSGKRALPQAATPPSNPALCPAVAPAGWMRERCPLPLRTGQSYWLRSSCFIEMQHTSQTCLASGRKHFGLSYSRHCQQQVVNIHPYIFTPQLQRLSPSPCCSVASQVAKKGQSMTTVYLCLKTY